MGNSEVRVRSTVVNLQGASGMDVLSRRQDEARIGRSGLKGALITSDSMAHGLDQITLSA